MRLAWGLHKLLDFLQSLFSQVSCRIQSKHAECDERHGVQLLQHFLAGWLATLPCWVTCMLIFIFLFVVLKRLEQVFCWSLEISSRSMACTLMCHDGTQRMPVWPGLGWKHSYMMCRTPKPCFGTLDCCLQAQLWISASGARDATEQLTRASSFKIEIVT